MKRNTNLSTFLFFTILIFFGSCSEEDPIIGLWDDNIKLSQKEATLSALSETILITTEGEWWWIESILLNDSILEIGNVDTTQDNFVIDGEEYSIERKNKTEIHITMSENESNSERILRIGLQAGNYFDGIIIKQEGK